MKINFNANQFFKGLWGKDKTTAVGNNNDFSVKKIVKTYHPFFDEPDEEVTNIIDSNTFEWYNAPKDSKYYKERTNVQTKKGDRLDITRAYWETYNNPDTPRDLEKYISNVLKTYDLYDRYGKNKK